MYLLGANVRQCTKDDDDDDGLDVDSIRMQQLPSPPPYDNKKPKHNHEKHNVP
jgi:hypothetical protein